MVSGSITDTASVNAADVDMDTIVICVESANVSKSANAPEAVHHQWVVDNIDAVRQLKVDE